MLKNNVKKWLLDNEIRPYVIGTLISLVPIFYPLLLFRFFEGYSQPNLYLSVWWLIFVQCLVTLTVFGRLFKEKRLLPFEVKALIRAQKRTSVRLFVYGVVTLLPLGIKTVNAQVEFLRGFIYECIEWGHYNHARIFLGFSIAYAIHATLACIRLISQKRHNDVAIIEWYRELQGETACKVAPLICPFRSKL